MCVQPPEDFPEFEPTESSNCGDRLREAAARPQPAKDNLMKAQEAQRRSYNRAPEPGVFEVGHPVLVSTRLLPPHGVGEKKLGRGGSVLLQS